MATELAIVLSNRLEELVGSAVGQLLGKPEFTGEPQRLSTEVRACLLALHRADAATEPGLLLSAALAASQSEVADARAYRRSQLVIEAIGAAVAEVSHSCLPRDAARAAGVRLRELIGPAQMQLAAQFRSQLAGQVEQPGVG